MSKNTPLLIAYIYAILNVKTLKIEITQYNCLHHNPVFTGFNHSGEHTLHEPTCPCATPLRNRWNIYFNLLSICTCNSSTLPWRIFTYKNNLMWQIYSPGGGLTTNSGVRVVNCKLQCRLQILSQLERNGYTGSTRKGLYNIIIQYY